MACARASTSLAGYRGAGLGDGLTRPLQPEAGRGEGDILEEFEPDAAHAHHDRRTHLGIAMEAQHHLDGAAHLFGDENTLQRRPQRGAAGGDERSALADGALGGETEQHEARIALVRHGGADAL